MIRVVYRLKAAGLSEAAFSRAWREAMAAIQGRAEGALGGSLLRSHGEPREYVIVTRWETVEAWRDFWSKGPPEPQGDPSKNEILIEIDEVES